MRYPARFIIVQLILHSQYSRRPPDIRILQPLWRVAACMRTRGRISRSSHCELERDGHSVPVRVNLASVIIALAFPALILSLSLSDSSSESGPSHHSVMVVRYACMAWQCGPTGPTFQPTRLLLFTMTAPLPATSPYVASPRLYCPTGQLTQKQVDLRPQGCALGRPNSPADQRRVRVQA